MYATAWRGNNSFDPPVVGPLVTGGLTRFDDGDGE
jgi:hypothetical protein